MSGWKEMEVASGLSANNDIAFDPFKPTIYHRQKVSPTFGSKERILRLFVARPNSEISIS